MKRRKGYEIDYAGKKYVSPHELCDDLDLPYSPLAHKYYRTKDIEQSVERAKKVKDAQTYTVWGREYKRSTEPVPPSFQKDCRTERQPRKLSQKSYRRKHFLSAERNFMDWHR